MRISWSLNTIARHIRERKYPGAQTLDQYRAMLAKRMEERTGVPWESYVGMPSNRLYFQCYLYLADWEPIEDATVGEAIMRVLNQSREGQKKLILLFQEVEQELCHLVARKRVPELVADRLTLPYYYGVIRWLHEAGRVEVGWHRRYEHSVLLRTLEFGRLPEGTTLVVKGREPVPVSSFQEAVELTEADRCSGQFSRFTWDAQLVYSCGGYAGHVSFNGRVLFLSTRLWEPATEEAIQ